MSNTTDKIAFRLVSVAGSPYFEAVDQIGMNWFGFAEVPVTDEPEVARLRALGAQELTPKEVEELRKKKPSQLPNSPQFFQVDPRPPLAPLAASVEEPPTSQAQAPVEAVIEAKPVPSSENPDPTTPGRRRAKGA